MLRFILLGLYVGASLADYKGHRLISINAKTKQDLEFLDSLSNNPLFEGLDFWTDLSTYRPIDVRASPNDFGKLRAFLSDAGIDFKVTNENIQGVIDRERQIMAKTARNTFCNIYTTYCTLDQIVDWLQRKAADNPNRMQLSTMNRKSWEGRDIFQVKIAENLNVPKKAIWIEAGTHAREWIAVSSALVLIDKLLDSSNGNASIMLSKYDWYIAPVHNPDGYLYTHQSQRLWRKNRQDCGSRFSIGTDLNRNWDSNFGGQGSSGLCSQETYRGQSAFSAPETAALRDAVAGTEDVGAFFSIHCYSQLLLLPYAYTTAEPRRYNELFRVAENMAKQLEAVEGVYFITGSAAKVLYAASGGAYDYFYMQGIPYSYTYELRPGGQTSNGFILDPSQIPNATEEVFVSLLAFVNDNQLDFTPEFL